MVEINQIALKKELISIYEDYLSDKAKKNLSQIKKIFLDYSGAENFLDEITYSAIMTLETIGWNLDPKITNEKAKEILASLKAKE